LEVGVIVNGGFVGNFDHDRLGQQTLDSDGAGFVGQFGTVSPGQSVERELASDSLWINAAHQEQCSHKEAARFHKRKEQLEKRIRFV
jgi:hypothetical protein